MEFSKHNILSKIADSENYFIVNPLSGQADILDPEEAKNFSNNSPSTNQDLFEKGYLVNPKEEEQLFKSKYLNFLDDRDSDEVQLFFTPWYTCNFDCSYCFQDEYTNPNENVKAEVVDAFFDYIDQKFALFE